MVAVVCACWKRADSRDAYGDWPYAGLRAAAMGIEGEVVEGVCVAAVIRGSLEGDAG